MKKIIRWICILFLVSCILDFGSNTFAQSSNLWNINMNFCNDNQKTNEIDTTIKAGEKGLICTEFTNISNEKTTINIEFVDAVITDDAFKKKACNAPDRPKTEFGDFIQEYTHTIMLQPWESVKKNYFVKFPIWFQGLSHWCIVYNIIENQEQKNDFLNIIIHSAKFIDMLVNEGDLIMSTRISSAPKIIKKGNGYIVRLWIENDGNIDEKVTIKWTIKNILGFQKEFNFEGIIYTNTGKIFESDQFILPFYKWPFTITTKVSYQPQFDFSAINQSESIKNIQWWNFINENIVVVREIQDIRFIGILGMIAILLWMIFKKRKNPKS